MYLLYCDESGSVKDKDSPLFILAGICVFERQTYWLGNKIEQVIESLFNESTSIELHAQHIFTGKQRWRKMNRIDRIELMKKIYYEIANCHPSISLFGIVVHPEKIYPESPLEHAYEQLITRFNHFLRREHKNNNTHRGLVIFDKSAYENYLQEKTAFFRDVGTKFGKINNLSELPLFLDSKASRLIQLADFIAYAMHRKYKHEDTTFFEIIKSRFDSEGDSIHGLYIRI